MFDFMLTTIGEKLMIGGQVTILGMGTVFAILALLWGLVEVLHLLLNAPHSKKKAAQTVTPPSAEIPSVTPEVPNAPSTAPNVQDLDIIAVITAAIAAATESSPSSFRVVSFKRSNNKFSGR